MFRKHKMHAPPKGTLRWAIACVKQGDALQAATDAYVMTNNFGSFDDVEGKPNAPRNHKKLDQNGVPTLIPIETLHNESKGMTRLVLPVVEKGPPAYRRQSYPNYHA